MLMLTRGSLAWSELYLTIANLFRRFDLELHDTTEKRDATVSRDCSIGLMEEGSVGIQVKIVKELTE